MYNHYTSQGSGNMSFACAVDQEIKNNLCFKLKIFPCLTVPQHRRICILIFCTFNFRSSTHIRKYFPIYGNSDSGWTRHQ